MGIDPSSTSNIPMLIALIILFIGLYFRGLILWISLALALLYLYTVSYTHLTLPTNREV